jgi:tRNA-2-methylthio-N6-dimethylallyladenosine synthase
MSVKKKLHIKTYGCQMNVYDSGKMVDVLADQGFETTDDVADSDLIILNTCHIREKAAEKVYSELGRIKKMKDKRGEKGKKTIVAVAGCVAQAEGAEMMKRAPVVDIVVGSQAYHRLPEMVKNAELAQEKGLALDFSAEEKFDNLMKTVSTEGAQTTGSSAFVSIQEGCDKFCTYCVVPYTRGAEFSRSVTDVQKEVQVMVDKGVKEIYLLGQNVNAYHGRNVDFETWSLGKLIKSIAKMDGVERIRYMTSHPQDVDDELIEAHRDVPELMPFLHLPLQAGSNRILKAMNRQHTVEHYMSIIDRFREARPDIAFSSDFIVGFPGETEEEFEQTMEAVRRVGYASTYSFIYSPRPGTPAATYEDNVPLEVKKERLARLQALINSIAVDFNSGMIGKTMPVIIDRTSKRDGQVLGASPYLQPVNVDCDTPELLMNKTVNVKIEKAYRNSLYGTIVV